MKSNVSRLQLDAPFVSDLITRAAFLDHYLFSQVIDGI
jgi:hypothetical protein